MSNYDETTVWMRKDAKQVLDKLCEYHDIKLVDMLALMVYSFSLPTPVMREALLEIGERVQYAIAQGMPVQFEDSLVILEQYQKFILSKDDE